MEKIGGIWMSSDVDTSSIGASVSAAVDKYDRYHVSYYGTATQDLLYAVSITPPTIPTNVNGTRGDHFVQLSWATPTSNGGAGVSKYVIYRGETPGTQTYLAEVSGSTLLYDDTTVTNGNTEYYTVVAVNSEGASVASHEFSLNPYSTGSTADDSSLMLLIIAGVIAIVVIAVVVILVMRRVKPKDKWKH
jgi:fibronectin type 3 domain-containing protein